MGEWGSGSSDADFQQPVVQCNKIYTGRWRNPASGRGMWIKFICLCKVPLLVSDNGMGMSADFKNTIFDPFTRAENSLTSKIQGTGLGMAITRNLVEAMGGTIDVESEPGQGSCFEVLIDLKIAGDRSVSLSSQAETDEPDDNILQGMHFLCAEDNELNAEILMELLKIEGAECTICENGEKNPGGI